ncbi:hypothetical protein F9279_23090 [Bacillus sp. B1-b2]|nr:hypothetical protein F9279_23090 [Bacillus sp. B1-b2]
MTFTVKELRGFEIPILQCTKRVVNIYAATTLHGCQCESSPIQHGEVRTFILPDGTYPMVKMWDYGASSG